jgi:hypothetical protein
VRVLTIRDGDRAKLEQRARDRSAPGRVRERSRIVLLSADGLPTRLLPEQDDTTHILQYNIAPQPYTQQLRVCYHQAIAATDDAVQAMRQIIAAHENGVPRVADSRAATRTAIDDQGLSRCAEPAVPNTEPAIPARRDHSDLAQTLRNLKVTDPGLMLRAVAIDHASKNLAAEARARARQRDSAIDEANGVSRHSIEASDSAAQLAARDHVGTHLDVAMALQRSDLSGIEVAARAARAGPNPSAAPAAARRQAR